MSPMGHWVHPGSLGSLGCALVVVGFVWGHSCAPWVSLDSFGIVRFTRVRPAGRWFHPESWGSLLCAQCVVEFVRGHWVLSSLGSSGSLGVYSGATWRSLGLSGVVGFTRVRSGGRWVHPGSLGSHGFALWIVGFILGRRVHSDAPSGSLGSSGVFWFTRVRPGGRWFHLGSPCSLWCPQIVFWLIRCHSGAPLGPLGSFWFLALLVFAQGVLGFILVSTGGRCVHLRSLGSSGVVWFNRVRPGGRWVHPGSLGSLVCAQFNRVCVVGRWLHPVSLCSLGCALGIDGVIQSRLVHSGVPRGGVGFIQGLLWIHLGSLGSLGFALGVTQVRPVRRWIHPRSSLGSSGVVGFIRMRPGGRSVNPGSLCSLGCTLWIVGFI